MVLAVLLEVLGHLRRQLARRLEDQRARHARPAPAVGEDVDHRQGEARRLAGAGLGDADQVAHHLHLRDGLGLDRSRLFIAGVLHGFQQFIRQAEVGKLHIYRNVRVRGLRRPQAIQRRERSRQKLPRPMQQDGEKSRKAPGASDAQMPQLPIATSSVSPSIMQLAPARDCSSSRAMHSRPSSLRST